MRLPEDVDRRSTRQPCRSCASPSSATPWLHWSRPGRVTHGGYSSSPSGNATPRCVSFSGAEAHVVLSTSESDYTGQSTTRSLECACSSSLAALCSVHVLQAQHKWATELSRTTGKSLSSGTVIPCLVRLWCHQDASQQYSASSSQPSRHAAGHADGSASPPVVSMC